MQETLPPIKTKTDLSKQDKEVGELLQTNYDSWLADPEENEDNLVDFYDQVDAMQKRKAT